MRALEPDQRGYIERDGVRVFYEVFGSGEPAILFCPTWTLVPSRVWKMQVPYLARHHRVIVFDPRGNGRSDRPKDREAYAEAEFTADAVAVLDATETEAAIVVGLSRGTQRALLLAAEHPERVLGLIVIGSSVPGQLVPGRHPLAADVAPPAAAAVPEATADDARLGEVQRRALAPRLPRLRRVVRAQCARRSRTRRRASRTPSSGAWGPTPRPRSSRSSPIRPRRSPAGISWLWRDASAARCSSSAAPATGSRGSPTRGSWPARPGGDCSRSRAAITFPSFAGRSRSTSRSASSPTTPSAGTRRRTGRTALAGRCSSPRRSGSATPAATSRSRGSCARSSRTWRSTGSPRTPSPACSRPRASGSTRPARSWPASRATSRPRPPEHELHCFQALRPMDEILTANYMVFDDVVRETALRPVDRRRGLGARLPPAREPGPKAGAVRLAHGLRRLPADARGRRARGHPDRRLQRRDDRAHRATIPRSETARSSSATPTTSLPATSARACR